MYIVRIIQRFGAAPDYSERHRDVGRAGCVRKLRFLAVDRVGQQARVDACHATLDVELTHEACLYDELLLRIALFLQKATFVRMLLTFKKISNIILTYTSRMCKN